MGIVREGIMAKSNVVSIDGSKVLDSVFQMFEFERVTRGPYR